MLEQTFERVAEGGRELLLVSGYSGVGKTALVNDIQTPVMVHGGYVLSGKCDQYQRNIPYAGMMSAFQTFIRQLMTERATQLQRWKESLLKAVGPNGQVVIDVIPELEQLLGLQPAVPHLGPLEAQNRFNYVFCNVFKAIAREEHPVALFLDDLQWVDLASLQLLHAVLTDPELSYFLLIAAYRDNEVDSYHPLIRWCDDLRQVNVYTEELQVPNLSDQAVNTLIAEALGCNPSDSFLLTQAVYAKTGGNALFTHQFLRQLYAGGGLCFDGTTRHWHWDLERLRAMEISDNVVDLLMGKIQRLPVLSQQILSRAACLGTRFEVETLSLVVESPEDTVRQTLNDAVRGGLLVPVNGSYRFVHDRIQQAVYSLISEAERAAFSGRTDAMRLYEQAITGAREQRYLHEEALSYELAARFYLIQGMEDMATLYIYNARDRYACWGAMAKVSHLERRYATLFEHPFSGIASGPATRTSSLSGMDMLDGDTIFKAAQVLFSELDLETLLRRLMQIMLENAGADKGALLLERDGELLLEAEGGIDEKTLRVMLALPLEVVSSVSQAIVNYVSRTSQTVVLDDALSDERFVTDRYIREHTAKSILCLPIVNQNTFLGLLYLENTIATAAFLSLALVSTRSYALRRNAILGRSASTAAERQDVRHYVKRGHETAKASLQEKQNKEN